MAHFDVIGTPCTPDAVAPGCGRGQKSSLLGELDRVVRLISFVEGFRLDVERLGVVHAYIRARAREALGVRRPGVAASAPDKSKDVVGKIPPRSFRHQTE